MIRGSHKKGGSYFLKKVFTKNAVNVYPLNPPGYGPVVAQYAFDLPCFIRFLDNPQAILPHAL